MQEVYDEVAILQVKTLIFTYALKPHLSLKIYFGVKRNDRSYLFVDHFSIVAVRGKEVA